MKPVLHCPICESKFTIEQAARESTLREMADVAARFGKGWKVPWEYSECFRRSRSSVMSVGRRLIVLQEALRIYVAEEFDLDGKRYKIAPREVILGMWAVVKMEIFGLQNQNYLKKCLLDMAERMSAEGLTAREEKMREEARRDPASSKDYAVTSSKPAGMTLVEWKRRQDLAAGVGREIA